MHTFPNLILTDFYEFRLYRDGNQVYQTQIARPFIAHSLKHIPPLENVEKFTELIEFFFSFSLPRTFTANTLAQELAKRTRFLRDEIVRQEVKDQESQTSELHGFFEAFKKYLIPGLDETTFADLYAQTLTYGLFAARARSSAESFNRQSAVNFIPRSIGILHDVFQYISIGSLSLHMEVIVDDIVDVLSAADIQSILDKFAIQGKGTDPIVHFYETFLSVYDPKLRETRGVYYTPEPVVGFIVRSLHRLLKSRFGLADGLASPEVTLLDPAAGTLTFPAQAIRVAVEEFTRKYGEGGKDRLIRDQILKNFHAFELMMAPYAIGHLKISLLLEELGYTMQADERFKLYLTNTLDMSVIENVALPGLSALSRESKLACKIKKQGPILVILGNPPYSGISSNMNDWTEKLLKTDLDGAQSYYKIDGQPLGEKKVWLQDDYVKFLRFAQWKIHKAGHGMVGMITNHGYLDNPTFRGIRQSLMKTFNEIYILNLHGNSLKKETMPDGSKDENVFDIRQGVAITILIKTAGLHGCVVKYAGHFGLRKEKYAWLDKNDFFSSPFNDISPISPWYQFTQFHTEELDNYAEWNGVNEIFPINVSGIVTARDELAIDFEKITLQTKIQMFRNTDIPDEVLKSAIKVADNYDWKLSEQREKFKKIKEDAGFYHNILYRPFDIRNIYYQDNIVFRTRREVMRHMLQGENMSICFVRQFSGNMPYSHFLISDCIVDNRTFFSSKGIIQQAPLYLYPNNEKLDLYFPPGSERRPNIAPEILTSLETAYGHLPSPEEILYYIYGVFYSPAYRSTYAEYLRIDFPRVPFAKSLQSFQTMTAYGQRLANLHLLNSPELDPPVCRYQGSGAHDTVVKVTYQPESGRVYINADKYFEGITPEMWSYQIGGYQVLMKYLKDRKGRQMDDPRRYTHIATAIQRTIEIQAELDEFFHQIESDYLKMELE